MLYLEHLLNTFYFQIISKLFKLSLIDIFDNFIFCYFIYFEMAWLCKLLESVSWSAAATPKTEQSI